MAYIDPGSGALVWQALLSAAFGALFFARRIAVRLRTLVPGRHRTSPPA